MVHGHFEPSALLSVLASIRAHGSVLVVLDLLGVLGYGKGITVRPGLEARVLMFSIFCNLLLLRILDQALSALL